MRGLARSVTVVVEEGGGVSILRKYTYSLSNCSMADGAFGLVPLADAVGTLHAEQVVAAGHQGRDHLAFETH